jgi:hypothetical protein
MVPKSCLSEEDGQNTWLLTISAKLVSNYQS